VIEVGKPPLVRTYDEARGLETRLAEAVHARREAELLCSRLLAEIEAREALGWLGCSSVGDLGEHLGMAADEARGLCDLGLAVEGAPLLEQKVREGRIPVKAACCVSRVLAHPELQQDEDDWIGWAETEPTKKLERRVRQRIEQARAGDDPVVPIQVFVRHQAHEQFQRARAVASAKAGRALTHGETFETVVDHYLDSFDVDRVAPGQRRVGPTTHVGGRYIPMQVRREIYERQGHTCAVPMCEHTLFLEHAHIVAHASGGSREADNLLLLCSLHHGFLDGDFIRLTGTAAKPVFLDPQGRDFGTRWLPGGMWGHSSSPPAEPDEPSLERPPTRESSSRESPGRESPGREFPEAGLPGG